MKTLEERIKERKSSSPYRRLILCYGCPHGCTLDQRLSDICKADLYFVLSRGLSLLKDLSAKSTGENSVSSAPPANRGVENT